MRDGQSGRMWGERDKAEERRRRWDEVMRIKKDPCGVESGTAGFSATVDGA